MYSQFCEWKIKDVKHYLLSCLITWKLFEWKIGC